MAISRCLTSPSGGIKKPCTWLKILPDTSRCFQYITSPSLYFQNALEFSSLISWNLASHKWKTIPSHQYFEMIHFCKVQESKNIRVKQLIKSAVWPVSHLPGSPTMETKILQKYWTFSTCLVSGHEFAGLLFFKKKIRSNLCQNKFLWITF